MKIPTISERLFGRHKYKSEEEKLKEEEQFKKLKEANLGTKDVIALIIALAELLIPIAIGIGLIYFFVILFLTKVWMKA